MEPLRSGESDSRCLLFIPVCSVRSAFTSNSKTNSSKGTITAQVIGIGHDIILKASAIPPIRRSLILLGVVKMGNLDRSLEIELVRIMCICQVQVIWSWTQRLSRCISTFRKSPNI